MFSTVVGEGTLSELKLFDENIKLEKCTSLAFGIFVENTQQVKQ